MARSPSAGVAIAGALLAGLIASVAVTSAAHGQAPPPDRRLAFGLAGGASVPAGIMGDETRTGFNVLATLALKPRSLPVAVRGDLLFSRFGLSDQALADLDDPTAHGAVDALGGMVSLVYALPTHGRRIVPYALVGGGVYNVRVSIDGDADGGAEPVDNTNFGLAGGAGLRFPLGRFAGFVEARYHSVATDGENTTFVPISVGLTF